MAGETDGKAGRELGYSPRDFETPGPGTFLKRVLPGNLLVGLVGLVGTDRTDRMVPQTNYSMSLSRAHLVQAKARSDSLPSA
jgi:hypothetical protein